MCKRGALNTRTSCAVRLEELRVYKLVPIDSLFQNILTRILCPVLASGTKIYTLLLSF